MATVPEIAEAIASHLRSKSLQASTVWINALIESSRLSTPLPALQKTALFRLLASDFTSSLDTTQTAAFPHDVTNVDIKERKLDRCIPVQVLDIEDLGRSRWSQVELLEQQERGEMTKGREIIRLAPDSEDNDLATNQQLPQDTRSRGPHKLLLQDVKGNKAFGFELIPVEGISLQMAIGVKLLLRSINVARGVLLLEPQSAQVIGGKIEAWEKEWRKNQKDGLKRKMQLD